jgi:hypothetical protein
VKNEARDAVANLRETLDDMIRWRNRIAGIEDLRRGREIVSFIDSLAKQIETLEAIDDNDLMEHAYNDLKEISHDEC